MQAASQNDGLASAYKGSALERRFEDWINSVAACPWPTHAGLHSVVTDSVAGTGSVIVSQPARTRAPLYTPQERERRDHTPWTIVQGVLAPVQFLAFAVSLVLVLRYLGTGEGAQVATASVIVKTGLLYAIMITGCIWEKVVFGKYLFAPAFFWEDVFSMLVLALHTAYLGAVLLEVGTPREQMMLALAAYAAYAINAAQFVWKLRMARLEAPSRPAMAGAAA
jgi:3-vinyl bacteriochlorophyllide hydratase